MSRLIYACRFDLPATVGIDSVRDAYKNWIEDHYVRRKGLNGFTLDIDSGKPSAPFPTNHKLNCSQVSSERGNVQLINWSFPSDYDDTLIWRNEIRFGIFETAIAVEHTILIDSIDFRVAPARIDTGSPRVIRRLCAEQTVLVGEMRVRATPYHLKVEGVVDFLSLLESQLRRLPIVFLSPYTSGESNEIDAASLAESLAGIAVVIQADTPEVTWEIADVLGRPGACYDGAARIYWPGFSPDDEPRRHPLYLASRISDFGAQVVARTMQRTVFSVAAFRFVPDPRMNAVMRAAESAQRIERLEERKADTGIDWEQYALELDKELTETKARLDGLEAENENLKLNQKVIFAGTPEGSEDEAPSSQPKRSPTSNKEAVEFAQKDFSNLIILDTAVEGASESPFRRPQELYDALSDLDDISQEWQSAGGDLRQHVINKGWGKRCSMFISDTTRRKYGNDYKFEYGGKKQFFEPHFTIGSGDPNSCASVHFIPDAENGKIVVAYVGRHLRNTKT